MQNQLDFSILQCQHAILARWLLESSAFNADSLPTSNGTSQRSKSVVNGKYMDMETNLGDGSILMEVEFSHSIEIYEPQRISSVMPPPKKFYRTFWRSITRRILEKYSKA